MLKFLLWYLLIGLIIGVYRVIIALQDPDFKRVQRIAKSFEKYLNKTQYIKHVLEWILTVLRAILILIIIWPIELLGEFLEYKVNQQKESE